MEDSSKNKWLIKDKNAKIEGPYSTEEIMREIRSGRFTGDEEISLFPGTKWYAISSNPDFYDLLLGVLSGEIDEEPISVEINKLSIGEDSEDEPEFDDDLTPLDPIVPKEKPNQSEKKPSKKKSKRDRPGESEEVIELKPMDELKSKAKKKAMLLPVLLISVALLIVGSAFLWTPKKKENRVRLIVPKINKPLLPPAEIDKKVRRGITYYYRDTLKSYLKAENEIVQAVEGQPKSAKIMAQLCAIYYELWPYSYQDSRDLKAISSLVQKVSKIEPAGTNSGICRVIDLMIRGRQSEASNQTETLLNRFSGGQAAPTVLYYLKARQLYQAAEYQSSLGYISSAQKLEARWLKLYYLEAQLRQKLGDATQAANRYRQIIKINKGHISAQIALGLIEYKSFRHYEKAQQLLLQSVKQKDQVTKKETSLAYLALAEMALYSGNKEKALGYAQNSYSLSSANATAKNLIVKLGGIDRLKKTKVQGQQLLLEGDQYEREGNCNAAQAHYKAAYKKNKKNGVAAMKAAKCLWKLSFTTEAISWLNKAIKADPKLIEAYTSLADYYTKRHNFLAAATVLAKARAVSPESYEVYRGYALVELRRRNYGGSVKFAERALKLYESDVETYILLSKALIKLREYGKAFNYARQAIELDVNSREADVVYALALAGVRGMDSAVEYLRQKIQQFPLLTEYRMTLGQIFANEEYFTQAEDVYRQVIELEEKPKQALIELGRVLRAQGKSQSALEAYIQAALLDPADADPLFESGQLLLDIKKPIKARDQFLRVKRINQSYPLVHYYLGKASLDMNQLQKAIEYSEDERKKNPNLADSYILAAEAYSRMRQYTLCAKEYQKAIRLRPQGAFIYVKLARCYRLTGNLDVAESMLSQASKKESGLPEIYKELGQIYEMKSNFNRAIAAYSKYLVLNPSAPDAAAIRGKLNSLESQ